MHILNVRENNKCPGNRLIYRLERVTGIEPVSSAWKAEVMIHYTTPANVKTYAIIECESDFIQYSIKLQVFVDYIFFIPYNDFR